MFIPQITIRSISNTPTIEYHISKQLEKVKRKYSNIKNCKIIIDCQKIDNLKVKVFTVKIDFKILGKELVSKKQNNNLYVAIHDSFKTMEKLIKKHINKHLSDQRKHKSIHFIPEQESISCSPQYL